MSQQLIRALVALSGLNIAVTGTAFYYNNAALERNYEEGDARMDDLEGTLRGHIGLIEESLERIEGMAKGVVQEGGWGKGMGKKAEELYMKRGKDDRKKN